MCIEKLEAGQNHWKDKDAPFENIATYIHSCLLQIALKFIILLKSSPRLFILQLSGMFPVYPKCLHKRWPSVKISNTHLVNLNIKKDFLELLCILVKQFIEQL